MLLIPAIDILDNQVVRLNQGVMQDAKIYNLNPIDLAKSYQDVGVKRLHIVDLNAARGEFNINLNLIDTITNRVNIDVELGGGIRDIERAIILDNVGVKYFILGTTAVKAPDKTKMILSTYPNRVILGLDAKGENLATDGWYETSDILITDLIDRYNDYKVNSIIYTDISKDGMLQGVNLPMIDKIAKYSKFPLIASGGVASIKDIDDLSSLSNKNILGCIIGKAIYENKINLSEVIEKHG